MSCRICGRGNCTSSFHSLEEQEAHSRYSDMSDVQLVRECVSKDYEIKDLMNQIAKLEEDIKEYVEAQPPI